MMSELAELSQAHSAAVFVLLLEDRNAAELLGRLGPDELERVGASMCQLGDVDPSRIARAIASFVEEADREALSADGREDHVRSLFVNAIGDVKAESVMKRIQPEERPRSLELARWLAPSIVAPLIEDEHPQVIAVLLLMMEAEPAAEILSLMPEAFQPRIVERIAKLGPVSGQTIDMLDTLLSKRIGERFGAAALTLGGAREAANLINAAAGAVGQRVLPAIEQRDAELAAAIEEEMFTFEMLYELDRMGMGRLLRDVENDVLVDALKGLSEDDQEPFFSAMSSRAADGVKDEIELRGKLRREDVQAAQKKIVEVARRLSDEGELSLGGDDGEFV
ncbi:flagellar motor switch protein FliG [Altererythrobacter lutimaris]|nr:flagellar motor switch protein FliG [Altererythrobacter lutimaris]